MHIMSVVSLCVSACTCTPTLPGLSQPVCLSNWHTVMLEYGGEEVRAVASVNGQGPFSRVSSL